MMRLVILAIVPAFSVAGFAAERSPLPDAAALSAARMLVKDIFKEDYVKAKPEDRQALAKKLFEQAEQTQDDLVSRYILCEESAEVASKAGDFRIALAALDLQDKNFNVDGLALKAKALEAASHVLATTENSKEFACCCLEFAGVAISEENFAAATKAILLAETAARNAKELVLVTQAQARTKEVRELQAEADKVKSAKEKLLTMPNDPLSNLAMGKFLCFVKVEWEKGLPCLAKGSDEALKTLAERDVVATNVPKELLAVADGWWAFAEKQSGAVKTKIQTHAVGYYTRALPGLSGIDKAKAQKRIEDRDNDLGIAWLSRDATYIVSSQYHKALPSLLNGEGGGESDRGGEDKFAFHTQLEKNPYIVVDLQSTVELRHIEIVNRKAVSLGAAKTLTIWVSNEKSGPWKEIWHAKSAEPEWKIELPGFVSARFVKMGLQESEYFHLYSVKFFGRKR